ncbi:MAG: GGDEF domain-containing protein [Lachnospiraceae bacterium]|nr:GGDEF domain-containing protein [Lachnospiraceae bacterium]
MGGWIAFFVLGMFFLIFYLKGKLDITRENLGTEVIQLEEQKTQYVQKIEELTQSMDELHVTAYTDAITKIGNKDYFMKYVPEKLAGNESYILLCFGISNIVTINRLYGSNEGDKVLTFAADIIRDMIGSKGVYAHVQSNLFAVLLPSNYGQDTNMENTEEDVAKEQKRKNDPAITFIHELTERVAIYSDIFQVEVKFGIYRISDKN